MHLYHIWQNMLMSSFLDKFWGPEAKLSLPPVYTSFFSPCHVPILSFSLHHVAGHVGNITGEILSTINSPSPYWLTHQHSSPPGRTLSQRPCRQTGMWAALALRSSGGDGGRGGVGFLSLSVSLVFGATSHLALAVPSWTDTTHGVLPVQHATTTSAWRNPSCLSRPWVLSLLSGWGVSEWQPYELRPS